MRMIKLKYFPKGKGKYSLTIFLEKIEIAKIEEETKFIIRLDEKGILILFIPYEILANKESIEIDKTNNKLSNIFIFSIIVNNLYYEEKHFSCKIRRLKNKKIQKSIVK